MTDIEKIESIVNIVRKATFTVKVMPFVYVFLYLLCMVLFFFVDDTVQTVLDMLFYVSPIYVVFSLIYSKIFKLCKWHKMECSMPLIPHISVIVDTFYPLSESAAKVNVGMIVFICILSLINAYYTFIKK